MSEMFTICLVTEVDWLVFCIGTFGLLLIWPHECAVHTWMRKWGIYISRVMQKELTVGKWRACSSIFTDLFVPTCVKS